jgi:lysophospholipid acyltransferase (LPLAT)-like uncharacterized protein
MIKRLLNNVSLRLIPFTAFWLVRIIALTMRFTYVNFDSYRKRAVEGGRTIHAFWHGRLLMMPFAYEGRGITIIVSRHRDGELIAKTVKGFGIEAVRGSSTRGWFGGVKGLLKAVLSGRDIAITPDGPRGPRYRAQMGVVQLARTTGLPILPMTFSASKKKSLEAGTPLSCPIPSQRGSSYAASLSM